MFFFHDETLWTTDSQFFPENLKYPWWVICFNCFIFTYFLNQVRKSIDINLIQTSWSCFRREQNEWISFIEYLLWVRCAVGTFQANYIGFSLHWSHGGRTSLPPEASQSAEWLQRYKVAEPDAYKSPLLWSSGLSYQTACIHCLLHRIWVRELWKYRPQ